MKMTGCSTIKFVVFCCMLLCMTVEGLKLNWSKIKPRNVKVPGAGSLFGIVSRITGGRVAVRGQFPWQVAVIIDDMALCGGSLATPTLIITAAHCTHTARSTSIFLGAHDITAEFEPTREIISSYNFKSHPQYTVENKGLDYDLSVVRLPYAVTYTEYIQPIRLPTVVSNPLSYEGNRARVSGWGLIADGSDISPELRYVDVTVISNQQCARSFGTAINPAKICVGTVGGTGPCSGDSGGPLVIQEIDHTFTLVGVVSFGSARGCTVGAPAVFTRITSYLEDPFLANELY